MINIDDFYNEFLFLKDQVHNLYLENESLREQITELNKDLCKVEAEVFDEDESGYTAEERAPKKHPLTDYVYFDEASYIVSGGSGGGGGWNEYATRLGWIDPPPQSCNHSWKSYVGLIEKYDYCEHCDLKKGA